MSDPPRAPPGMQPPPPPPPAPAPDARGTFEQTPLVYVLVHVLDRRFTGTLIVRTEEGTPALLTLREGAVVRVEMPGQGDFLGEEAVAAGACTEEQASSSLAIAQGGGSLLGEELVLRAGVAPEMVRRLLLLQTAKRVATLVNLPPKTTYALHLGALGPAPNEPWAPLDVLLAAVRAWSDRPRIHGTIRFVGARPLRLHPAVDLSELLAMPIERKALEVLAGGEISLETLYRTIGSGLSSLIYLLAVTRQLVTADNKAPMGRPPGAPPIEATNEAAIDARPALETQTDEVAAGPLPAPYDLERSASPSIVIAPLPQPITESFTKADTVPGALSPNVPRVTAPYPVPSRLVTPPAAPAPSPEPVAPAPVSVTASALPRPLPPPPPKSAARLVPPQPPSPPPPPAPPSAPAQPPPSAPVSKSTLPSAMAPPSVSAFPKGAPAPVPPPSPPAAPPVAQPAARASVSPVSTPPVSKATLASATAPPSTSHAPAPAAAAPRPVVPAKPPAASKAPPRETSDDPPDIFKAVETALTRHDFKAADALAASVSHAVATRPDYAALLAWVGAHSGDDDALPESVRALTRVLEENPKCQPALYYRGMLLKRAGKDKAALRDFVTLLYENPTHLHALSEVRDLRKKNK